MAAPQTEEQIEKTTEKLKMISYIVSLAAKSLQGVADATKKCADNPGPPRCIEPARGGKVKKLKGGVRTTNPRKSMLPENAITLTKPNGTYLVDRYEKNVTGFRTGYDKFKNIDGRPSDVNTKGKKIPNTSNHFTAGYNLYVHDANLSLEASLGILAKLTKSIPMYKAAGAKMPATYNSNIVVKVPLDARFNKNTTVNSKGETVISIGAENNVAGENISDTTSHSLQGVLDRAKATFPFELKLVPEAMDVYVSE